jgi:hypothetical protein
MVEPAQRGFPPRLRRTVAAVAFVILFIYLAGGNPLPEFRSRLAILRQSVVRDLPRRRLEGSAAAFDRRFAALVLAARDALPPGTTGVALYASGIPEWGGLYLAIYEFAPIPVIIAPRRVPAGWLALTYGPAAVEGLRVVRRFEGGALLAPP